METFISILGIISSIIMFFLGKKIGQKEKHEDYIQHEIDKLVDLYNDWDRRSLDNGIHALSKLGLEILENDYNIQRAINKIEITSGKNPFGSQKEAVEKVNLFELFKFIREKKINVLKNNIFTLVQAMQENNLNSIID